MPPEVCSSREVVPAEAALEGANGVFEQASALAHLLGSLDGHALAMGLEHGGMRFICIGLLLIIALGCGKPGRRLNATLSREGGGRVDRSYWVERIG